MYLWVYVCAGECLIITIPTPHMVGYILISASHLSYHIISYHIISYHIISYHIISYHIISYHIISYHIISYHIISYHIISYHIISYLIVSGLVRTFPLEEGLPSPALHSAYWSCRKKPVSYTFTYCHQSHHQRKTQSDRLNRYRNSCEIYRHTHISPGAYLWLICWVFPKGC